MSLPGDANNVAALKFALNRLMAAQHANLIGPQLQFGQGQQLLDQYHHYSPTIAHQVHQGASLAPFNPQPAPAPAAQPRPAPAPLAASGGNQSPAANQVKVNITLPHHSPATSRLLQTLMGGHQGYGATRPESAGF
jgi:hypothetical protein